VAQAQGEPLATDLVEQAADSVPITRSAAAAAAAAQTQAAVRQAAAEAVGVPVDLVARVCRDKVTTARMRTRVAAVALGQQAQAQPEEVDCPRP